MACAPTGSGKTIAYLFPILCHIKEPKRQGIRSLILAPTRELARQVASQTGSLKRLKDLNIEHSFRIDLLGSCPSLGRHEHSNPFDQQDRSGEEKSQDLQDLRRRHHNSEQADPFDEEEKLEAQLEHVR